MQLQLKQLIKFSVKPFSGIWVSIASAFQISSNLDSNGIAVKVMIHVLIIRNLLNCGIRNLLK